MIRRLIERALNRAGLCAWPGRLHRLGVDRLPLTVRDDTGQVLVSVELCQRHGKEMASRLLLDRPAHARVMSDDGTGFDDDPDD